MKDLIKTFNIFILFSIIFFMLAIMLGIFAFNGTAIAVPFFTKVLFLLSFVSLVLSIVFFYLKRNVKVKIEDIKPESDK